MKQSRYRKYYQEHKETMKAKSKRWYDAHREYCAAKAAERRKQKKEKIFSEPKPMPPSMESREAKLPYSLRKNVAQLRREFLDISILERPPYDEFIQRKAKEYYDRRSKD